MTKEPSGGSVLNSGESDFRLVSKTKLIRIPRPQKLLAIQDLLFILCSLWLGDFCTSDGLLQYLVLSRRVFVADLKLLDDPTDLCNPGRIITVERLNVYQALAKLIVRKRFFQMFVRVN